MKAWVATLVLIFCSNISFGQNFNIQEIKDYYYKLKSEMKETVAHSGEFEYVNFYVFCFIKPDESEFRYYFQKGKLLDYKEKNVEDSDYYDKESWRYLIERAKD